MQMQPHFLFNTLNSIVSLVHRDPHAAERMVVSLGEMLRASLAPANAHEVTLREELSLLAPYLEIESTRFRGRLSIRTAVPPEALDARLPQLTLQPLVENAIRHGVAPRRGAGCVEVRAERTNGLLRLTVWDDGAGDAAYGRPGGIGLENLRARLAQLYGDGGRLRIAQGPAGGTTAEVLIPCRTSAPAGDAERETGAEAP
jgi:LytS/YehU family sensor histidine kinase